MYASLIFLEEGWIEMSQIEQQKYVACSSVPCHPSHMAHKHLFNWGSMAFLPILCCGGGGQLPQALPVSDLAWGTKCTLKCSEDA